MTEHEYRCWHTFPLVTFSYHDNDEVEPAPGVGEVFHETKGQPLDAHLEKEDDGEDPVHVVEDVLQDGIVF